MTVYADISSHVGIAIYLRSNKLVISALQNAPPKLQHPEQHKNGRQIDALEHIDTSAKPTGSDNHDFITYPRWIAGVGEIIGPVDRIYNISSNSPCLISLANPASTESTKPGMVQEKPTSTRTALRRHCDFWDTDGDGLIYPWDIYRGFQRLGFHVTLCLWAAITIAICASYNTHTSYVPHPLFAINLNNINSNRHGSSTGTYDMDGELDENRFDAIFRKYARGKDYLTLWSTYEVWRNQRCGLDLFGWFAGGLEWVAMYILLWPEDGLMTKAAVRGVFDGSIFYTIAENRARSALSAGS